MHKKVQQLQQVFALIQATVLNERAHLISSLQGASFAQKIRESLLEYGILSLNILLIKKIFLYLCFSLLLFYSISNPIWASETDSLKRELALSSVEEKIPIFNKIGMNLVFNQPDSGKYYAEKSLYLNNNLHNKQEAYISYRTLGDAYQYKSEYSISTKYYLKALNLALAESDKSKVASVYNSIGMNYYYLLEYKNAKNYLWRAAQLKKENGQELHYAMVLANIVGIFSLSNQVDSAFYCARTAEKILLKNKDYRMLSVLYNSIGTIYQIKKINIDSAAYFYLKSLNMLDSIKGQEQNTISTLNNLGQVYTLSKEFGCAKKYLERALSIAEKYKRDIYKIAVYNSFKDLYLAQYDYKHAFEYLEKSTVLKDTVLAIEKQNEVAKLQTEFHSVLKDKKIKKQEFAIQKSELMYEKEKSKNYLVIAFSISFIILLSALAFVFWLRKKTKETIEKEKSRFFSNVVHEFRTPLTLIKGPLEEIKRNHNDTETLAQTQLIENNSNRLLNLVNQLLDVSKVEAGKFQLNKKMGNLSAFLEQQAVFFKQTALEKKIHYLFDIPTETNNHLFSADALEKICFNLLSNAFKYTSEGGMVSFTVLFNENQTVSIEVKDTGMGIPSKELVTIFQRFYQSSNGKQRGGTGIGLSLTKELVDLLKGKINVSSQQGKGSCFTVILPITYEEEHSLSQDEAWNSDERIVLLVEDDKDIATFVKSVLQAEHFTVLHAKNGREGLEKVQQFVPDLIITDIMMPVMDGIEMAQQVKQAPLTQHIPIIALSAKASQESKLTGLKTGINTYLGKPFHPDELRLLVQNILQTMESVKHRYNEQINNRTLSFEEKMATKDAYLKKVIDFILQELDNSEFSVEDLANKMAVSRSQLHRKITGITGYSISSYMRLIRLEKAHELLQNNAGNVSEVAYATGFSSQPYFSKCFHEHFGYAPKNLPKKV
jgi:signal transduction histidine kinase/DNA-binding response OmpR family regulator